MDLYSAIIMASVLTSLGVGIVAIARGGGRVARFSFGVGSVGLALWLFAVGSIRVSPGVTTALGRARAAGLAAALLPLPWTVLTLVYARADARAILRRWRPYLVALTAAAAFFAVRVYVDGVIFGIERTRAGYEVSLGTVGRWMLLYLTAAIIVMLFNLETTARCAAREALSRIKFALAGAAAVMVFNLFVLSLGLLYSVVDVSLLAAGSVPVLAAAALLGYTVVWRRLSDESIPVGRPVFYTSVTAFVSGIYLLLLGVLGWTARARGLDFPVFASAATVFLSLLILVMFLLSSRARRGVRRFVDTNFYLNRYDYRREWAEASRMLSAAVDASDVVRRTEQMVSEMLDAERVSVLPASKTNGSYELSPLDARDLALAESLRRSRLMDRLASLDAAERVDPDEVRRGASDPTDVDSDAMTVWGLTIVAPLRAAGELVGVIAVGRPRGVRYTTEDLDLLTTLGAHAGNAVLAARLAERLAVSRELESFHRLSSFVVHDLKNCVSALSLSLSNAERNMGDPQFRRDLLETVSDSAGAMKGLIERLTTVRSGLELDVRPVSLVDVVERAVEASGLSADSPVEMEVSLDGVPEVSVDAGALVKVFVNLFLNAVDAMNGAGRITVRATRLDGAVAVAVEDTGPGIDQELIASGALFVPFRSSTFGGLGLGLHQVKTVVEAHGGSVRALNTGAGARFVVSLPAAEQHS